MMIGRSNDFASSIWADRKSTRLNSSHANISYAVFCLKKKKKNKKKPRNTLSKKKNIQNDHREASPEKFAKHRNKAKSKYRRANRSSRRLNRVQSKISNTVVGTLRLLRIHPMLNF